MCLLWDPLDSSPIKQMVLLACLGRDLPPPRASLLRSAGWRASPGCPAGKTKAYNFLCGVSNLGHSPIERSARRLSHKSSCVKFKVWHVKFFLCYCYLYICVLVFFGYFCLFYFSVFSCSCACCSHPGRGTLFLPRWRLPRLLLGKISTLMIRRTTFWC